MLCEAKKHITERLSSNFYVTSIHPNHEFQMSILQNVLFKEFTHRLPPAMLIQQLQLTISEFCNKIHQD